jgi:carboxypeptidase C (cathepsin A)
MADYRDAAPDTGGWTFEGPRGEPRTDWGKLLAEAMADNPRLRVLSANGYYDRTSSFGQARQLFSRNRLPRERIVVREYPGGHALYQTPDTALRLSQDIRAMIAARTA